jgi:hypothetical protein
MDNDLDIRPNIPNDNIQVMEPQIKLSQGTDAGGKGFVVRSIIRRWLLEEPMNPN